ncbi:6-aminopenicillanic acid acyl-transferase [Halomonas daqingensis]|uniref:C45 family autoproteolytic acyltransferase/hydolase n=1 Tax=Billgrantia desiderata TaxID=52021 RepID=UPI001F26BCC2|nr:C45 family peptidase [Halomonas desiderata]MCE8027779.1 6-aminopenicillanic acid acyl-transferase [Halomonas desiderata]
MYIDPPNGTEHRAGLRCLRASGDHRQLGYALGQAGRRAVHDKLLSSELWQDITHPRHDATVARMLACCRSRFPWVLEELEGLAEGLELPFLQVFAWNSRGDLLSHCPDGCTTVVLPGLEPCIAHNEDGLPCFDGDVFVAQLSPVGQPSFMACCYPGSLPGHTFALTELGIVQAVNNLRFDGVVPAIPRMVLGRAMLAEPTLDAILSLLAEAPASGGFHFTLAQQGERRLYSVEIGSGQLSIKVIDSACVHANHALHHPQAEEGQTITRSSRDRQQRGDELIASSQPDPLRILRDTGGSGLPIYRRAPDDPDHENTLATGVFRLLNDGVQWEIHPPGHSEPFHGSRHTLFDG